MNDERGQRPGSERVRGSCLLSPKRHQPEANGEGSAHSQGHLLSGSSADVPPQIVQTRHGLLLLSGHGDSGQSQGGGQGLQLREWEGQSASRFRSHWFLESPEHFQSADLAGQFYSEHGQSLLGVQSQGLQFQA